MHAYVEQTKVEVILNKLNNYHPKINFIFDLEKNNEIHFFNLLIKRVNDNELETGVYWKAASTDSYSNGVEASSGFVVDFLKERI